MSRQSFADDTRFTHVREMASVRRMAILESLPDRPSFPASQSAQHAAAALAAEEAVGAGRDSSGFTITPSTACWIRSRGIL